MLLLLSSLANCVQARSYSNEFAVFVPAGPHTADRLAAKYGFRNTGQIGDLNNFYLFEHRGLAKRSANSSLHHEFLLTEDPEVGWFEQQRELRRVKRDLQTVKKRDFAGSDASDIWEELFEELSSSENQRKIVRRNGLQFSDPMFLSQWFLNGGGRNGADMNVKPAWDRGYTGKGVVVSILDDGIQHNHPDLAQNYDRRASTDINDSDTDPMPQDNGDNKHGTRCAGEVAAVANNGVCGVGIAYNASIGGVRMLDGVVNDAVEARALSLNPDHIDIYSASWGPEDDGRTVDGPGPLAKRAFLNGVTRGRKGRGSIFVWASGNGGRHIDDCNCDGYTNSIWTLSVSSATENGLIPWYSEACSSTMATTYSSGSSGERKVVTTDLHNGCTSSHTGTSASAPMAAGLIALVLEANPNLTWRDVQHITVRNSQVANLRATDWRVNALGRNYSHSFGYGVMDASGMVKMAQTWTLVPQKYSANVQAQIGSTNIPPRTSRTAKMEVTEHGQVGKLSVRLSYFFSRLISWSTFRRTSP